MEGIYSLSFRQPSLLLSFTILFINVLCISQIYGNEKECSLQVYRMHEMISIIQDRQIFGLTTDKTEYL